jgi:hypothetical protein
MFSCTCQYLSETQSSDLFQALQQGQFLKRRKNNGINDQETFCHNIRFKAFTATKFNKIPPGFQPRQLVKKNG